MRERGRERERSKGVDAAFCYKYHIPHVKLGGDGGGSEWLVAGDGLRHVGVLRQQQVVYDL